MPTNNNALESNIASTRLDSLQDQLANHPLYNSISNIDHLRVFMQHHVFAVWDFMSLIKSMQSHIAPTTVPWVPCKHPQYVNFVNQLVLEEESDHMYSNDANNRPLSHFELYLAAMREVGATTYTISRLIHVVREKDLDVALKLPNIPGPAKKFMTFTFDVINSNQPHLIAASLAWGREDLVPQLFRALQRKLQIDQLEAPNLFAYLDRHIQLDEQEHAPIAIQLAQELCVGSSTKQLESLEIAEQSLAIRLQFWDGIYRSLQ